MEARYLKLKNISIFDQLQLEEALLRTSSENWVIVNEGSSPAIVMGIGGKIEQLINVNHLAKKPIPLIRRFSGGGTVVVDSETIFVTLIFQNKCVQVDPYPVPIMNWTEELYRPLFGPLFHLKENDYCYGQLKFGGNAQSITKGRWLHHTSLLWNFKEDLMTYLKIPKRQPSYRNQRSHKDFLTPLSAQFSSIEQLTDKLKEKLNNKIILKETELKEAEKYLDLPHRKATQICMPTI